MSLAIAVIRAFVGVACLLLSVHHAHAQTPARGTPFVAEAQYTDTFVRAANGEAQNAVGEVARDRSGRMRVDWGSRVIIADPVEARYLYLDTAARTVREHAVPRNTSPPNAPSDAAPPSDRLTVRGLGDSDVRSLGTKVIEGYLCEGRLFTQFVNVDRTRPESGVKVETEVWIAEEIGPLLVVTRTSEGRQTRYELKNIRIEEAPPGKFAIPPGFARVNEAAAIVQ